MQSRHCFLYIFLNWTQEAKNAFSKFGELTALLDNPTVLTVRMNSDNAKNGFTAFMTNTSTLISKLLVAEKKGKPKLLMFANSFNKSNSKFSIPLLDSFYRLLRLL